MVHQLIKPTNSDITTTTRLRTILVAVAGGSPAIVTETLWALTQQQHERIDEVRVITTETGKEKLIAALLGPGQIFRACCLDSGLSPETKLTIETLKHRPTFEGNAPANLYDIRNDEENQLAADQICELIRAWTSVKDDRLLCSVAGGRKTMSIYLTIAMMLYGRVADRLFHVLVQPAEFERCHEFLYPTPTPRRFNVINAAGQQIQISSAAARIDLADIRFVRLREISRHNIDFDELVKGPTTYNEIVDHVQTWLRSQTEALPLRIIGCRFGYQSQVIIKIGEIECRLPPAGGILYTLIAERHKLGVGGLEVTDIAAADLVRVYELLRSDRFTNVKDDADFDFLIRWVELARNISASDAPKKTRTMNIEDLKGKIEQARTRGVNGPLLKQGVGGPFLIVNERPRGKPARYLLQLAPELIELPALR